MADLSIQPEIPGKTKKVRKRSKNKNIIPGFGINLGITIAMVSILILIPLASILVYSLQISPKEFFEIMTSDAVRFAFGTSILCSFIAALINAVFGTIIAWVLVRYEFPGKRILDGLIELPFALPTAVAGITLSKMYSSTGLLGKFFNRFGIEISYTHIGLTIALVFIGIPFVVRAIQPVLEKFDYSYEEAAHMLGASKTRTFFKVILKELSPAILTGFGLAFARGIGEYGSVVFISGNSFKEHTQVVSYVIMQKLNYLDYGQATAIALTMLVISFLLLLFVNMVQIHQAKRVK